MIRIIILTWSINNIKINLLESPRPRSFQFRRGDSVRACMMISLSVPDHAKDTEGNPYEKQDDQNFLP
jgi:hypothetical protein